MDAGLSISLGVTVAVDKQLETWYPSLVCTENHQMSDEGTTPPFMTPMKSAEDKELESSNSSTTNVNSYDSNGSEDIGRLPDRVLVYARVRPMKVESDENGLQIDVGAHQVGRGEGGGGMGRRRRTNIFN